MVGSRERTLARGPLTPIDTMATPFMHVRARGRTHAHTLNK